MSSNRPSRPGAMLDMDERFVRFGQAIHFANLLELRSTVDRGNGSGDPPCFVGRKKHDHSATSSGFPIRFSACMLSAVARPASVLMKFDMSVSIT